MNVHIKVDFKVPYNAYQLADPIYVKCYRSFRKWKFHGSTSKLKNIFGAVMVLPEGLSIKVKMDG